MIGCGSQTGREAGSRLGYSQFRARLKGPVYSGVMTDANEAAAPVHDRMLVLLRDEYQQWLQGSFDDLLAFKSGFSRPISSIWSGARNFG